GQRVVVRDGAITSQLGPLKGWTAHRYAPPLAEYSFRDSWKNLSRELEAGKPEMEPDVLKKLQAAKQKQGGKRDE
ncbi:hypothetical protein, partial [Acinetobacter baumannii]|uniref:hypothetical protein n=1 Tax=Acinetobacter baumannii TaxID=470 RepID=UPI001969E659